jgi:hypothetical protein
LRRARQCRFVEVHEIRYGPEWLTVRIS